MPTKTATTPDRPCSRTAVQPQRRRLLLHGILWAVPLFCPAILANAASSADAASFDWDADPAAARAAALMRVIGEAHWVQEGAGPRIVYIFFDPNCPYSHKLYLATRAEVGKAGLQLRWIPVGQLEASSPGKAAAILSAPDPLAAF
ncbi:MAG: hypothetical protein PHO64_14725, partial [Thiomonas sp.]|nr:hypothetical protein [Thiomonas sp.]